MKMTCRIYSNLERKRFWYIFIIFKSTHTIEVEKHNRKKKQFLTTLIEKNYNHDKKM